MAQDAVNHRVYQSSTMTASVAPHRSLKKLHFMLEAFPSNVLHTCAEAAKET